MFRTRKAAAIRHHPAPRPTSASKICPHCSKEYPSSKARNGHMRWCNRELPAAAAEPPLKKRSAPVREDEFDDEERQVASSLLHLCGDQSDEMLSSSIAIAGAAFLDLNLAPPEEKPGGL
ncbi:unnamed protein product [Spirodela intermedia]|uniref:Uncharacterized protein n=2 Tax=Spirodela intermedia TaxID=51605 RepID=A0A7I8KP85_SPIIN|nr:unnamed protein product [Spirodela intermedia]CAA6663175.1 unnamed protein product [Spirodela intermedia]CAA7399619.1 unnamed protein product [Spirodela intermedia]